MHLHLPKPPHGWREFLSEVAVIVVGISIAIGAEQTVEWFHHRSEVNEAIASLRVESNENLGLAASSIASLQESVNGIDAQIAVLGKCQSSPAPGKLAIVRGATYVVPVNSAWLGIRDSALLPLMPKDVVSNYARLGSNRTSLVSELGDLRHAQQDAATAVDLLRHGIWDRQACTDAARQLLHLRRIEVGLWFSYGVNRAATEQVLKGKPLTVGYLREVVRKLATSRPPGWN